MKRFLFLALALALLVGLTLGTLHATAGAKPALPQSILLLTSEGAQTDSSALAETLARYAQERDLQLRSFQIATGDGQLDALADSLQTTPRVVICLGGELADLVFTAQSRYPELPFLLLDAEPRRALDGVYETQTNTHALRFDEGQQGFLLGYAAVMDGGRKLGFLGSTAAPAQRRYGYGFMQGAEAAAQRLSLPTGAISLHYRYEALDAKAVAARRDAWYAAGVSTIFCSAPQSALLQSKEGTTLLAATKDYGGAAYRALLALEENEGLWPPARAGCTALEGLSQSAISLVGTEGAWPSQSPGEYRALCTRLITGEEALDPAINRERFPLAPHCSLIDEGEA